MKFISYAQNFEDVILNRAFKGRDQGFYLDVGAADPIGHSVTKNFYERGWRGINIEPGSAMFKRIEVDRPRDINLNVGISRMEGNLTFYEAPDSCGISTFNATWREGWEKRDGANFVEKIVPVMTLTQVCERYVDQPIDFLKIDAEGHEPEVLAGADFARWRPRVVVVEGDRKIYQDALIRSNYLHATFDGVNHYFVSEEEMPLIDLLNRPVSLVADNFELHELTFERDCHQRAYRALLEANRKWNELEAEVESYRLEKAGSGETAQALQEVTASRDELEATLHESKRELAEMTARHDALRARIAPLIEVRRALRKVHHVLTHPAHQIHRLSSNLRSAERTRN